MKMFEAIRAHPRYAEFCQLQRIAWAENDRDETRVAARADLDRLAQHISRSLRADGHKNCRKLLVYMAESADRKRKP